MTPSSTGLRCLPQSKLVFAHGNTLHDWHAEVVAIRAFNLYLLRESLRIVRAPSISTSSIALSHHLRCRQEHEKTFDAMQPLTIKEDVKIYMYSSTAPCGDASMELTMAGQEDPTPWPVPVPHHAAHPSTTPNAEPLPSGRSHFSLLGIVRRKPARADAPPTLSKSCSDKLAMAQCTSLLSSLTSLLVHPGNGYLSEMVLPEAECVPGAIGRAFGVEGRMAPVVRNAAAAAATSADSPSSPPNATDNGNSMAEHVDPTVWRAGYTFRPFTVTTTRRMFDYSRVTPPSSASSSPSCSHPSPRSSNISAAYTSTPGSTSEVLINGTRSGHKQFARAGASSISRRSLWAAAMDVAAAVPALCTLFNGQRTYADVKRSEALKARGIVKRLVRETALKGWTTNDGDENWTLV